jgi:hypothetical protein
MVFYKEYRWNSSCLKGCKAIFAVQELRPLKIMINTVPSTTSVSKPLAPAGAPPRRARHDPSNFMSELSDAMGATAGSDAKADLSTQAGKLQTPNAGAADNKHQSKDTIPSKSVDKQASGDKATDAKDQSELPDDISAELTDPSLGGNSVTTPIIHKPVKGTLVDEHQHKSANKKIAQMAQKEGEQSVSDPNLSDLPDASLDHSDRDEISITKIVAATKPASGEEKSVSAQQETPEKKDDTPANQTALGENPIDPLTPNLFMADAPLIASSADFASSAHGNTDALKLTTAPQHASSNKSNASQEAVPDGIVAGNEMVPVFATGMQTSHLTEKSIKAHSHTGLRAEKSDQTVSATQDGSPNPTIETTRADANQDLGVSTLPNGELLIGKDQLPKAMQDQLSNIGTAGSTTAASRGPIPYAMLPIELGLSALNGKRSIDVLLSPAELGTVEIRLEVSNHSEVKAHIKADRPETLSMLMDDSYALKSALDQTGMTTTTDSLQFSLRQDSQQQSNSNHPSHQHANKPQRAYERSDTSSDPLMSEAIPLKPLTRGIGLLDVQI